MTNEELVAEIQQGKNVMDNMQQLYFQNKPLIHQTVKPYVSYADIDDLMQESYFGLHRAVELYKPETGNTFITYAIHWIRQSASIYAMNTGNTKRLPINVVTLISRHKKFLSDFQKQYNQPPTDKEVCNNLNITQKKLNNLLKFEHELNCTSMDAPIQGADGDISISESVASDTDIENDVVENVTKREAAESLWYKE
jgi:RNA polymerase sigma factor (sigma-70 family)